MTRPSWVAVALWLVFAIVVFNVIFDWQTRMAGYAFVDAQQASRVRGLPLATLEEGFRPMVGMAAARASMWALLAIGIGVSAIAVAAKRSCDRPPGAGSDNTACSNR
jgi:hypothetical protein